LTYCLADEDEKRFLAVEEEDLEPHLARIQDQDLAETLRYGIGFYHEALSALDKKIVTALFEEGAIKCLVASKVCQLLRSVGIKLMNRIQHGLYR
jgi:pre-mRNA-splicing helicase BRR2